MADSDSTSIVTLAEDGEPRVSTLAIAKRLDLHHKNVLGLVRSYADELLLFGAIAFETRNQENGGRPTELAPALESEINERLAGMQPPLFRLH